MVEQIPIDNRLRDACGIAEWSDTEWLLWDVSAHVRTLLTLTYNINRGKGRPEKTAEFLPHPGSANDDEGLAALQAQAESELRETLRRRKEG